MKRHWWKPRGPENKVHGRFKSQILTPKRRREEQGNKSCCSVTSAGSWCTSQREKVLRVRNESHCAERPHKAASRHSGTVVERAEQCHRVTGPHNGLHSAEKGWPASLCAPALC
ncbi:PREDICTED: 60S ribosomal protein L32-like [Condylura cristata]|uniref:60S ribosomal protein L32-like n=1 Tax=Condylura cristata TaxID=143302 RepID=UPI0006433207|nr:PREDICTED: 60S ribosomal protein L32-like [Condylura cristata]